MYVPRDLPNILMGAVVIVVVIDQPLAPLIGGAVAAGFRRSTPDEGVRVGAIAGVLATGVLFVIGGLQATTLALPEVEAGMNSVYFAMLGLVVLLYIVILSAFGGFLGDVTRRFVRRKIAAYR